ncbi:hypothetical protein AAMO2058_000892900 [Amorphochlora amoebiformis]
MHISYLKIPTNPMAAARYAQALRPLFGRTWARWFSIPTSQQKVVKVAVLGTPNAGKSVLVNRMVDTKISAESPKRNTTRREILGILTEGDTQLILTDTPGIVAEEDRNIYESELVRSPWEAITNIDAALVVIDAAKRLRVAELQMLAKLKGYQKEKGRKFPPLYLCLNKIDLVKPNDKLFDIVEFVTSKADFEFTHYTCAPTGDGVFELLVDLLSEAKPKPWPYPADARTDLTLGERVAQVLREKIFERYYDEVPYQIGIEIEEALQLSSGPVELKITLNARSESQKRVLLGKQNSRRKHLEITSGKALFNVFGRPVNVQIHIKTSAEARGARS